ncbi:hypothetical protein F5Y08DRAFT_350039 [Xylaria arbuscula]|nr:hypothetical protein F5Y08DRAFT_350039 [Xylaria arbuscula]
MRFQERVQHIDASRERFLRGLSSTHGYNQHIQGSHRSHGSSLNQGGSGSLFASQDPGITLRSRPPSLPMHPHSTAGNLEAFRSFSDVVHRAREGPLYYNNRGYSQPPVGSQQNLHPPSGLTYTPALSASQNYWSANNGQLLPRHMHRDTNDINRHAQLYWCVNRAPSWGPIDPQVNNDSMCRDERLRRNLEQLRSSNEAAYYCTRADSPNGTSNDHEDEDIATRDTSSPADIAQPETVPINDAHLVPEIGNQPASRRRSVSAPFILRYPLDTVSSSTTQDANSLSSEEAIVLGWDWGEIEYLSRLNDEEEVTDSETRNSNNNTPTRVGHDISIKEESEDGDQQDNRVDWTPKSIKSDPESEVKLHDIPLADNTGGLLDHASSENYRSDDSTETHVDRPNPPRESPTVSPQYRRSWSDVVSGRKATPTSSDPTSAQVTADAYVHATDPGNALTITLRQLTDTARSIERARQSLHDQIDNAAAGAPQNQPCIPASGTDDPAPVAGNALRSSSTASTTLSAQDQSPATTHPSSAVQTAPPTPTTPAPVLAAPNLPNNIPPHGTWSQVLFTRTARPKKPPNLKPRSESGIDETDWPALGSSSGPSKNARKRNPSS